MKGLLFFLFVLFLNSLGQAITVEKFTLVPRKAQVFVGNIRTALNSTTGTTLVIWDRNTGTSAKHSVWGRRISSTGVPSGKRFQIVKGPNAQAADITFNQDDNEFLLVYSNETNGPGRFEVFAQRLNAKGKRAGNAVRISPPLDRGKNINNFAPNTIYDSKNHGYFVMWRRYALDTSVVTQDGLYGTALNTDLSERKAPVLMSPLQGDFSNVRGPFVTDIGFHPTNGKLLITGWSQSTEPGFSFQYFLARADATLKKFTTNLTKLTSGLSTGAAPYAELVFLSGNKVEALFVEGTGVKRRSISTKGKPTGSTSLFFTAPVQAVPLEFPVSALASGNGDAETAVIAIDDSSTDTGKIWLQTANGAGTAVGTPFELQSNLDIGAQPEISALPNPAPSGFLYAVIYVEGVRTFPPDPNESSGLVLLKVNTSP